MTTASRSTVGTNVYLVDRTVSPAVIVAIPALRGLSNVGGGSAKKLDKSNMDSTGSDEYIPGRNAPAEATGEIVLVKSLAGHQKVKKLYQKGCDGTIDHIDIYVGDGDATNAPTLITGTLTPPKTASPVKWARSGTLGVGYISKFAPKKQDNDIDMADFGIQWSGTPTWQVKDELISLTY